MHATTAQKPNTRPSVVQSRGNIYVTNTALDFRHFFADESPITRFTLSRVRLNPSLGDD